MPLMRMGGAGARLDVPRFLTYFPQMKLFSRSKPEANQSRTSPALLDMAERMDRLERKMRDLETDWQGTYDKFHRLNMRIAQRAKRLEAAEEETPEDRPRDTNGGKVDPGITNPLAIQLMQRGRRL